VEVFGLVGVCHEAGCGSLTRLEVVDRGGGAQGDGRGAVVVVGVVRRCLRHGGDLLVFVGATGGV